MVTISCPHCRDDKALPKHGTNRAGTARCRCMNCSKTFTLNPIERNITPQKEAAILRHLEERTTIGGICRALQVSPNTIYATLKKSRSPAAA